MSEMHVSAAPLKPAVFYILLALVDGDSHGYAVMQAVRERSGGRLAMQTGSFYRHLAGLLETGLVAEVAGSATAKSKDPRRGVSYRLTQAGRTTIEAERERLVELLKSLDTLRPSTKKSA
jgi:DNA-binding PadR family transcriptional regulator